MMFRAFSRPAESGRSAGTSTGAAADRAVYMAADISTVRSTLFSRATVNLRPFLPLIGFA